MLEKDRQHLLKLAGMMVFLFITFWNSEKNNNSAFEKEQGKNGDNCCDGR